GVLAVVRGREVQQTMGVEGVGAADRLEAEVEPLAGRDVRHLVVHRTRLVHGHAVLLGEVDGAVALALARSGGVELEAAPRHADVVAVRERRQGTLEPALADVAPGAGDVRPDLDVHGAFLSRCPSNYFRVAAPTTPGSHARTAPATAWRSVRRLWSPDTWTTTRCGAEGGMPNGSRAPCTTSVGTSTSSSSASRLRSGRPGGCR